MIVYALSGVGFTGSNLILARVLPTEQYALFTLVIALGNLGYSIAPLGLDGVVTRRHLDADRSLLGHACRAGLLVGLGFAAVGILSYGVSLPMAAMLLVSAATGGLMVVASARLQSEQRFAHALALGQSPNVVLLGAALASVATRLPGAWLPVLISTVGFVAAAVYGWSMLLREGARRPAGTRTFSWAEAIAFAGFNASGLLLIQLERLVLPHLLPLAELAVYGVLGAIAGSVYRVMQMGVGFSLLPRLRAATTVVERRRLIAHEARLVGGMVLVGSAFIWIATPLVERYVLAGKYHLGTPLLLAAVVSGIAKIANSFAKATASAMAEPRELSLINAMGWVSVGLALLGAYLGAHWGLTGVIYGVALGWGLRAVVTIGVVARHLRLPISVPAVAP
jgi:O-antigen/teichoic acid export membrane protein